MLIHVHGFEDLRATFDARPFPLSVGHLGYMKTDNGIDHPGFGEFLYLLPDGNTWVKLSGSLHITTSPATSYEDATLFARAIIEANEDRVTWGTDCPPFMTGNMLNDGVLLDHLMDWAPDPALRKKILVDNGEALFGF